MKTVLVVGDRESGKDDLIEFILHRGKKVLPDYGYLKFENYMIKGVYNTYEGNLKDVRKFQREFQRKVLRRFEELVKKHQNIIINAHFFARLKHGYVSLLTGEMFKVFKPDAVIIIELYPKKIDPKFRFMLRKENPLDIRELRLEQDMIRKFAALYTSSSDSLLRVVQVDRDNVNRAFSELMDVMTFVLSDGG